MQSAWLRTVAAYSGRADYSTALLANSPQEVLLPIEERNLLKCWSGRRESNPRMQLGKLPFYH